MLRKGQKVETLTKKVGQAPRTGVIIDLRGDEFVEVQWDDGHVSTVSASTLVPAAKTKAGR